MIQKEIIADSRVDLDKEIADYFRQYPSAGYGTNIKSEPFESQGKWCCLIQRAVSCD
jgi:hypothetical protein